MKKRKLNSKNPKYNKKTETKEKVTKKLVQITTSGTKIYTIHKD
jgi:hypothetical protein